MTIVTYGFHYSKVTLDRTINITTGSPKSNYEITLELPGLIAHISAFGRQVKPIKLIIK